jgi:hypothetical protein
MRRLYRTLVSGSWHLAITCWIPAFAGMTRPKSSFSSEKLDPGYLALRAKFRDDRKNFIALNSGTTGRTSFSH